jgi:hypothetical protein
MPKELQGHLTWLKPIVLDPDKAGLASPKALVTSLRRELGAALERQGYTREELKRCVYVIRMVGDFTVAYPDDYSPVLYIGRGDASVRLGAHLRNWLSEVRTFGREVKIEVRICRPRRRAHADLFKFVEARLIRDFQKTNGAIPFFNSRRENKFESGTRFTKNDEKKFRAAIGLGRRTPPQWAIQPTPANPAYEVYNKGVVG